MCWAAVGAAGTGLGAPPSLPPPGLSYLTPVLPASPSAREGPCPARGCEATGRQRPHTTQAVARCAVALGALEGPRQGPPAPHKPRGSLCGASWGMT